MTEYLESIKYIKNAASPCPIHDFGLDSTKFFCLCPSDEDKAAVFDAYCYGLLITPDEVECERDHCDNNDCTNAYDLIRLELVTLKDIADTIEDHDAGVQMHKIIEDIQWKI